MQKLVRFVFRIDTILLRFLSIHLSLFSFYKFSFTYTVWKLFRTIKSPVNFILIRTLELASADNFSGVQSIKRLSWWRLWGTYYIVLNFYQKGIYMLHLYRRIFDYPKSCFLHQHLLHHLGLLDIALLKEIRWSMDRSYW